MVYFIFKKSYLWYNYEYLDNIFKKYDIDWVIVIKFLCGNEDFLKEVIDLGIKEVCDSWIFNFVKIKKVVLDM